MKGKQVRITTTPAVIGDLEQLARTGLFGSSVPRVAEQLIRERLRELRLQGWTGGRS